MKNTNPTNIGVRTVVESLERAGWVRKVSSETHVQFIRPGQTDRITLPLGWRTLSPYALRSIEKASGLDWR